jgi:hypothetical protein
LYHDSGAFARIKDSASSSEQARGFPLKSGKSTLHVVRISMPENLMKGEDHEYDMHGSLPCGTGKYSEHPRTGIVLIEIIRRDGAQVR